MMGVEDTIFHSTPYSRYNHELTEYILFTRSVLPFYIVTVSSKTPNKMHYNNIKGER